MISPRATSGFTLTELLLACGMLLVVFMLAMVALRSIGQTSDAARCTTNLRQIAAAAARFSGENNDALPSQTFNRQKGGVVEYLEMTIDFIGNSPLTCPTLNKKFPPTATSYHHRSYSINCITTSDYKKGLKYRRKVATPAQTLFFLDGMVNPTASKGDRYEFHFGALNLPELSERFTFPHHDRCQGVFLDGHVEAVANERLADPSATSVLWYSN